MATTAFVSKVTRIARAWLQDVNDVVYNDLGGVGGIGASSGSSLVGFLQSGTGAVARTVEAKNRDIFSLFDFIPVAETAAIQARTSTTNVASYVQAAFDAIKTNGGGMLFVPRGKYRIGTQIALDKMPMYRVVGEGGKINTPSGQDEVARSSVFENNISGGGTMFKQDGTVTAGDIITGPCSWEHVAFDCTGDNTNHVAFDSRQGYDMQRFIGCGFLGGKWGWTSSIADGVFNVRFSDCSFFDMKIGCYLPDNGSTDYLNMVWEDCLFRFCSEYGVDSAIGNSFYFRNCMVESCTLGGLRLDSVFSIRVEDSHFEQNGTNYDLLVKNTTQTPKTVYVAGCTATRNTGQNVQMRVEGGGKIIFIANSLLGAGGTASLQIATAGGPGFVEAMNQFDSGYSVSGATEYKVVDHRETTYTPTWAATGTAVSLGNGTITGGYTRLGDTVHLRIVLTMGGTTTFGTGDYTFTLPFTAGSTDVHMGVAHLLDSGTADYVAFPRIGTTGTTLLLFTAASPSAIVGQLVPFTWAANDTIEISITYKV